MTDIPPQNTLGPPVLEDPPEQSVGPPVFDNGQSAAILALVTPLIEAAVALAVAEAARSTPVPTFRPGSVRGVDAVARTCSVLLDSDDETVPGVEPITAQTIGQHPYLGARVMVVFSPPSSVYAHTLDSGIPPGMVCAYAGPITSDSIGDPDTTDFAWPGWIRPYGQLLSATSYAALYTAIGTTFNTGGESAIQFRAPDMRGRAIFGLDNMGGSDAGRLSSANTLGTTMGSETHTTLPDHTHSTPNHTHAAGSLAGPSHTHSTPSHTHSAGSLSSPSHSHNFTTNSGGSHQHSYTIQNGGGGAAGGVDVAVALAATTTQSTYGSDGSHTHGGTTNTDGSGSVTGSTANDGSGTSGGASSTTVTGSTANDGSGTTGNAGSGASVNHMPPGITLHWLIKV